MATEVECIIYFPDGGESPDQDELEAVIRLRYEDAVVTYYIEEEC